MSLRSSYSSLLDRIRKSLPTRSVPKILRRTFFANTLKAAASVSWPLAIKKLHFAFYQITIFSDWIHFHMNGNVIEQNCRMNMNMRFNGINEIQWHPWDSMASMIYNGFHEIQWHPWDSMACNAFQKNTLIRVILDRATLSTRISLRTTLATSPLSVTNTIDQ